eukprot:1447105-Amphidinium_carterae.2
MLCHGISAFHRKVKWYHQRAFRMISYRPMVGTVECRAPPAVSRTLQDVTRFIDHTHSFHQRSSTFL